MAPKEKKTKEQIQKAALSGGKSKKKKWSKGKQKDKLNNAVYFEKAGYEKLMSDIPKSKLITPSIVSERLHINASLARAALKELEAKKLIRPVGTRHHAQQLYTRVGAAEGEEKEQQ